MYTVIASTRRGPLVVAETADQDTAEFIAETTWQGREHGDMTTIVAAPEHTRESHITRCWTDAAGRIYADIIFAARNLEKPTMQDPDITCARCSDRGTLATDYGIVRCDCDAGTQVDYIPDRTPEQHRQTAYDWSSDSPGHGLALYQWASTNGELINYPAIMAELEECIAFCRDNPTNVPEEATDYDNLRSLRRHIAIDYAPAIDYDEVPL